MIRTILSVALVLGTSSIAMAQSTPGVDARQSNQQQRINQGVRSGELNAAEAARLKKGQANVKKMEDQAKSDGVVTKGERQQLQQAQDKQSGRIFKQKHDAQTTR